jgi:integrase
LAHRDLSQRTRDLYSDLLRLHIKPQLGSYRLTGITPADVRRWHTGRLAATTRTPTSQAYRLLRAVLNTAVGDGLLSSNPCQIKGASDPKTAERPYMSQSQAARLIDALPPYLRIPGTITVLCHLRLGELLGLQRRDVDVSTGVLHVRRAVVRTKAGPITKAPKNGHAREIHMPPEVLEALRRHLLTRPPALPSAPLFLHPSGVPLAREHVGVAWRHARTFVSLTEYRWHDLRHAGLTWASEAGATIRETMHRAGHKSMRAAMIYQHQAQAREATLAGRLRLRPEPSTSVNVTSGSAS